MTVCWQADSDCFTGGRGGFSGELGVQQFVEKGEVKLSDGEPLLLVYAS